MEKPPWGRWPAASMARNPPLQWGACGRSVEGTEGRGKLTYHPLDPDDIVGVGLGAEVLEATAEVVPHPLALLSQVRPGRNQEVFRHVHHVHHSEERQQQPLGDPTYAGSAVQGAGGARLVRAFLRSGEGRGSVGKALKA